MTNINTYTHHIGQILKVLVYIEDHLDEPLSLDNMAKIACISSFYFHRLFQAYVGKTLAEYVKELRLRRAAEALQYSDKPITDIAFDVGYESPSSFTKVFNQVMGSSPRQYRKAMQPIVKAMIERTLPTKEQTRMLQPEYVTRQETPLLFVRRTGDYNRTPPIAFEALQNYLRQENIQKEQIASYYTMGLDDPQIVERSKCRFDCCVALKVPLQPKGEVGQKILRGGRFAVFNHEGPYTEIENSFYTIFRLWYPTANIELSDEPPYCEFPDLADDSIPDGEHVTKLYIPLVR